MTKMRNYRVVPFTMNRRMVAASASIGRERNNIHAITEVDITEPRRAINEHRQRTGERLSLTAFIITCLARAIAENPTMNSFRKGGKLVLLQDVTISALVEREIAGEQIPEPFGIKAAQTKTYRQIHDEIRSAQQNSAKELGGLSGSGWIRFIPAFLMRAFIRAASRNIRMINRFGVVGITAVGMFGNASVWFIPLSGATVAVTVGGITRKSSANIELPEIREYLCLTVTFNHDIIDGAPAARFLKRFSELLMSSELLHDPILESGKETQGQN